VQAGFILQLDCPDLALGRHTQFAHLSLPQFRDVARMHVEVLNHAVADIPADRMRMHICWASTGGPHHRDVPLRDIADIVITGRPCGIVIAGANPRHEHEWKVWKDVALPAGKVLVAGMIDSTTNFIEHPELVAERIVRYAGVVGRDNVIAGVDCGFGTFAGRVQVDTNIVWHKLRSLVEGARLASKELW
jgi:5-methyltetrahydropteroyltriglutamate--homocysteine methyltransferase